MAYAEFFVTKGASVSNVNGGGPDGGANDAPIVTKANCASNPAGTSITNADADGWGAAAADDWICFDTAGAKDFARITDVAGNVLTVTPAVTGGQANKNVNVGGAWATVDHMLSTVTTSFVNAAGDPPRMNVKYNAVAYDEQARFDYSGSATVPLTLEGYETTYGDWCPNGNLPEISSAGVGLAGVLYGAAAKDYLRVYCLHAEASGANIEAINLTSDFSHFRRLHLKATGGAGYGLLNGGYGCTYDDILVEDSGGYGIDTGVYAHVACCVVLSAASRGLKLGSYSTAVDCIVAGAGTHGIYTGSNCYILDCIAYGTVAGPGIYIAAAGCTVKNGILSDNSTYGIEAASAAVGDLTYIDYNTFYNNGTAETHNIARAGANNVTLTASPFVDAAGGNFAKNDTIGGGAACRDVGFPGTLVDGVNVGHTDSGALQRGRSILHAAGMSGGMEG